MTVRRASAASGPAPSYEGDDRTNQDHNSSSDRENSNPLPDPALFPFIRRHVTSLMFFSTSVASLLSQNMPIVDLKYPLALGLSVSNPQQLFPLPQFPFEAHAPGNLKRRDHASLDLLAALSGSLTRGEIPGATGRDEPRRRHARWLGVGPAAVRRSLESRSTSR